MLHDDGLLWPAAQGDSAWKPGVNLAYCATGAAHEAPDPDCRCGIYAFHTIHRQLAREPVIGAIAAFGAMEVHRDGFRAGQARILALAENAALTRDEQLALERAAERYEVPIVPRALLRPLAAMRTGLLPLSVVAVSDQEREQWLGARRGYDAEQQLWAEPGGGMVTVGVSAELRAWLCGEIGVEFSESGYGAVVRLKGAAASIELQTGIRGEVLAVNRQLGREQQGWIVRIAPTDWAEDCDHFDWSATGRAGMVGIAERDGAAGFEGLQMRPDFDLNSVASFGDVMEMLRAERARPPVQRYADDRELYDELGIALGQALARDEGGRRHLAGLDLVLALDIREPAARLSFDFRDDRGTLHCGTDEAEPDVVVSLVGNDLDPLLAGQVDLAKETRTGRLQLTGSRPAALGALSVLSSWSRRT